MTTYTACFVLCFIWVLSLAIVIPTALYSGTHDYYFNGGGENIHVTQCSERWPNSKAMKAYTLVLVIGEFLLPLTIMSVVYFLIARKLWFRRVPGGHATEQQEMAAESSKRRTVRLLIIVVALFAFCWAPYHMFAILRDIVFPSYQESHLTLFLTVFYLVEALAMSNSMFNTLIYVVFNANVRKYVLQIPDSCRRLKPSDKATVRYWHPLATRTSSHCMRSSVRSSQLRTNTTSISTRLTINLNRPTSCSSGPQSGTVHDLKCWCFSGLVSMVPKELLNSELDDNIVNNSFNQFHPSHSAVLKGGYSLAKDYRHYTRWRIPKRDTNLTNTPTLAVGWNSILYVYQNEDSYTSECDSISQLTIVVH